ncbi:sensor histidine kinase [Cystobacter fuscus]
MAQLASNDAQLRGATLTLQLADTSLPVRGDGVQLQQVVLNLIINALDAVNPCPPGERQVWVRTQRVEGRVELVVEDTGVGLSPEARERLFEPFFTTKPAGLGMGLSISRSILEVHQGRLQAEPRPGRGTLFRCSFRPIEAGCPHHRGHSDHPEPARNEENVNEAGEVFLATYMNQGAK